jgi:hypothetical protein
MPRLLLLAYGRETEYHRAILAALSCWAWQPRQPLAATIFTDQPACFEPYLAGLPVEYHLLTPDYLAELRGPQQYVHRVKAQLIAWAFAQHAEEEILFIDSDTFFLGPPDKLLQSLAAGQPIMHQREYKLAEAVGIYAEFNQAKYPKKLLEMLSGRRFALGGAEVQFHPTQSCWNSGVLGLPRTLAPLLPDMLRLIDELYAGTGWFISEQLGFSLALQAQGPVQACDQYVYHYWGQPQKKVMDKLLLAFLTPELAALPLAERLLRVRQQLPRLRRQVELGKAQEGALYAMRRGRLAASLKCAAKALLTNPLDAQFVRELLRTLHRQTRLRHAHQWARR